MPSHDRLDHLLASLGYASRRDARDWVRAGRIRVGTCAALPEGTPAADAADRPDPAGVRVDGEPLDHPGGVTVLLNKPAGRVCSHDPKEGPSVYDLLPARWRRRSPLVSSVGRLDKETTGLLILTDHSGLVHRLTSPRRAVAKVYAAGLDRDPPEALAALFASGTLLLDGERTPCAPAELRVAGPRQVEVTLTEGRYHQVRRMFASQGLTVLSLDRIRLGSLVLGDLERGCWREINPDTLNDLG